MIRKTLTIILLKFQIVRCANCLVLKHMVSQKEAFVLKFSKMYASNQFSSKETDDAKIQFDEKANRGQQNETAK